jgi:hypothetical protein
MTGARETNMRNASHYLTPLPIFGVASYLSPRYVRQGHNPTHGETCRTCGR